MSSSTAAAPPTRQARHARAAIATLFLTNGAIYFNIVPRYPEIKAELGLSNAALGAAIAAFPVGALLAGLAAGIVIRRFRSSRTGALGIVLTTAATLGVAVAPNAWTLAAALFVVGALDSIVDVAQNAHGLRVQRLYGRSIVNSLHGVWSIGAVIGGLMGSAAAGLRLPLPVHLTISAVLFSVVAVAAYRYLLPGHDDAERADAPATVPTAPAAGGTAVRLLAVLGILAACGALVEDAGASWGAVYMTGSLNTSAALGGLAVVALQTAMTIGRLTGDRVVDRFGQRTVVRTGGALAAIGMAGALAFPSVPGTLAGFALAGLGVATLVPAAMHTADELPGLAPGTGLTVVSWLLRGGFLLSPPLIGLLADQTSLRVGLFSVVAAGLITVLLSQVLVQRTR
ncbi:MFS transporter [Actinoplanes italicus]|uniref:Fucose permease n=1 Tax=Actinoplanes italicus TaxID=113567 RepID=A0A2T0KHC4_9ACTN|nr:MFS transporter [Actinoplanes italicus]PRX22637.1 fucose permease [Actinoplanes italicus]GIE28157.1 MFS transporter [Actinoplanes italicus]